MPLLKKIIAPGVGLVAEAIAHRKSRTPSPQPPPKAQQETGESSKNPTSAPPAYSETAPQLGDGENVDSDEEQWELDDAAAAMEQEQGQPLPGSAVPQGNIAGPATIKHLISAYMEAHPVVEGMREHELQLPVILPQRRPRDKSRGFVRAYAPLLGEVGITEGDWIGFLETFDQAIKISPVFQVINIAASAAGIVPSPTIMAVTTAVTIANEIAKRSAIKARTNSFLDEINAAYFQPQGLYVLVMTFKPDSTSASEPTDISSTIAKRTQPKGGLKTRFKQQRLSDGTTRGEVQLPLAAPLVFPALDHATAEQKDGWMKSSKAFVTDYMDRRAQAEWATDHPDSALATNPEFKSSLGHPSAIPTDRARAKSSANDFGRSAAGAGRRGGRRGRQGPLSMALGALAKAATKGGGAGGHASTKDLRPVGMIKKALKPNVLYLMVVPMPSQEEMAQVSGMLAVDEV